MFYPNIGIFKPTVVALAISQTMFCAPTKAAIINVDPSGTPGGCALVEAIRTANSDTASLTCVQGSGNDIINLPANETFYTYAGPNDGGIPIIDSTITINGNGSTIQRHPSAFGDFSQLEVKEGNLTLNRVTLSGGQTNLGGGVKASIDSTLTVTNSTVSGNLASNGAGVYVGRSTASFTNSTVSSNSATGDGAGIYNFYSEITISNSNVIGNSVDSGAGGGLSVRYSGSRFTITNSTVSSNSANRGGGLFASRNSIVSIENSTVSKNTAANGAGLFFDYSSTSTLVNSTVTGNLAGVRGGGIHLGANAPVMVANGTTIFANTASPNGVSGGGLWADASALFGFNNTVIANSSPIDCAGQIPGASTGNWFQDSSCSGIAMGDPKLGPLAFNGGPTKTHGPMPGSGLQGAGVPIFCLSEDQRGETRNNPCFIGAVEGIIQASTFFVVPLRNGKSVVFSL